MIVIMKLRIKSLPNLVGRQGRVLLQWYGNPVFEVMLLDKNEPTSYGEAMVGPDSDEWLEAIKIRERIHVSKQSIDFGRTT